jgi:hypothetical protein
MHGGFLLEPETHLEAGDLATLAFAPRRRTDHPSKPATSLRELAAEFSLDFIGLTVILSPLTKTIDLVFALGAEPFHGSKHCWHMMLVTLARVRGGFLNEFQQPATFRLKLADFSKRFGIILGEIIAHYDDGSPPIRFAKKTG